MNCTVYELKVFCGPLGWDPLDGRDGASQLCTYLQPVPHMQALNKTAPFFTLPDVDIVLHKFYSFSFFSIDSSTPLCLITTLKVVRKTIIGHTVKNDQQFKGKTFVY